MGAGGGGGGGKGGGGRGGGGGGGKWGEKREVYTVYGMWYETFRAEPHNVSHRSVSQPVGQSARGSKRFSRPTYAQSAIPNTLDMMTCTPTTIGNDEKGEGVWFLF